MSHVANLVARTRGDAPLAEPLIRSASESPVPSAEVTAHGSETNSGVTSASASAVERANRPKPRTPAVTPAQEQTVEASGIPSAPPRPLAQPQPASSITSSSVTPPQRPVAATERESQPTGAPSTAAIESAARPDLAKTLQPAAQQNAGDFHLMAVQASHPDSPAFPASGVIQARSASPESSQVPTVQVHIGRVDVRLVTRADREARASTPPAVEARPESLDDYLRERMRGQR